MKPFRLKLTHDLVLQYGLHNSMDCYIPHAAAYGELTRFHSEDYIQFLQKIMATTKADGTSKVSSNISSVSHAQCRKYNVGPTEDCPAFEGIYELSQLIAGGSLDAAVQLGLGRTDVAIHWAGGFHHAKKAAASGFCYVNGM